MSTGIYRVKLEDLTWGFEFAEWLNDAIPHDGDMIYISRERFDDALKEAPPEFLKEHEAQIMSVYDAIKASEFDGIDVWISW